MADEMNPTMEYLRTVDEIASRAKLKTPARLVLRLGQSFEVRHKWPKSVPLERGPARECFRTCTLAALNNPRFIYCEGMADAVIPVDHAWVMDSETGRAYDLTWKDGVGYFGVAFDTTWLRRRIVSSETYGILGNLREWGRGWQWKK